MLREVQLQQRVVQHLVILLLYCLHRMYRRRGGRTASAVEDELAEQHQGGRPVAVQVSEVSHTRDEALLRLVASICTPSSASAGVSAAPSDAQLHEQASGGLSPLADEHFAVLAQSRGTLTAGQGVLVGRESWGKSGDKE